MFDVRSLPELFSRESATFRNFSFGQPQIFSTVSGVYRE